MKTRYWYFDADVALEKKPILNKSEFQKHKEGIGEMCNVRFTKSATESQGLLVRERPMGKKN